MNERIKKLIELLQMSPSDMSVKLNVQRSTFSHLLSGRNKPSFDFISSFLSEFPNVNPDYLILGKLPYLRSDIVPNIEATNISVDNLFDEKEVNNQTPPVVQEKKTLENGVYKSEDIDHNGGSNQEVQKPPIQSETKSVTPNDDAPSEVPKLVMVIHHYSNGTFTAYTPK
jgi:hypothetical protein